MIDPLGAIRRTWFASRKVRLPIPPGALVLEVGSGDNPCPRSNVLLDLTLDSYQRAGGRTVIDRPLVLGIAEKLPFRTHVFDYVVAFHVLEHSSDPAAFLAEIQRVGRAGYIETPSFWAERVQPIEMHRLEVGLEEDEKGSLLVLHKKLMPRSDVLLADQFRRFLIERSGFGRLHPEVWVTRYHWRESIRYRIANPETPADWPQPSSPSPGKKDPRSVVRNAFRRVASAALRPRRKLDLISLLRCIDCGCEKLVGDLEADRLECRVCGRPFHVQGGVPFMHPADWHLS